MDDRELGRRIGYWRRRRKLTQAVFADRIGRSKAGWRRSNEASAAPGGCRSWMTEPESRDEELLALYGHILLQGAMAAAASGDDARTSDLPPGRPGGHR